MWCQTSKGLCILLVYSSYTSTSTLPGGYKLHQRLGKPAPLTYQVVALATSTQKATTKTVTVTPTPPRINFVGGKKLSMSGNDDSTSIPTQL